MFALFICTLTGSFVMIVLQYKKLLDTYLHHEFCATVSSTVTEQANPNPTPFYLYSVFVHSGKMILNS